MGKENAAGVKERGVHAEKKLRSPEKERSGSEIMCQGGRNAQTM